MKKIFAISLMVFMFCVCASAQTNVFDKGSNILKAGVGFGRYTNMTMPPIHISYETKVYQIADKMTIGVGGYAGMLGYASIFDWGVGANALLHFSVNPSFDFYTGPDLNYGGTSFGFGNSGGFGLSWILGAQFFFTDNIGLYLQEGGFSVASIGVAYRF